MGVEPTVPHTFRYSGNVIAIPGHRLSRYVHSIRDHSHGIAQAPVWQLQCRYRGAYGRLHADLGRMVLVRPRMRLRRTQITQIRKIPLVMSGTFALMHGNRVLFCYNQTLSAPSDVRESSALVVAGRLRRGKGRLGSFQNLVAAIVSPIAWQVPADFIP